MRLKTVGIHTSKSAINHLVGTTGLGVWHRRCRWQRLGHIVQFHGPSMNLLHHPIQNMEARRTLATSDRLPSPRMLSSIPRERNYTRPLTAIPSKIHNLLYATFNKCGYDNPRRKARFRICSIQIAKGKVLRNFTRVPIAVHLP